eukprot:c19388_g1_i3.p1 GENE.c19388_g1_i3~~c19388_g1_i3.p1  ORF type:complete len:437 (+),score=80.02 c19388_g1_i3:509-1819(+)
MFPPCANLLDLRPQTFFQTTPFAATLRPEEPEDGGEEANLDGEQEVSSDSGPTTTAQFVTSHIAFVLRWVRARVQSETSTQVIRDCIGVQVSPTLPSPQHLTVSPQPHQRLRFGSAFPDALIRLSALSPSNSSLLLLSGHHTPPSLLSSPTDFTLALETPDLEWRMHPRDPAVFTAVVNPCNQPVIDLVAKGAGGRHVRIQVFTPHSETTAPTIPRPSHSGFVFKDISRAVRAVVVVEARGTFEKQRGFRFENALLELEGLYAHCDVTEAVREKREREEQQLEAEKAIERIEFVEKGGLRERLTVKAREREALARARQQRTNKPPTTETDQRPNSTLPTHSSHTPMPTPTPSSPSPSPTTTLAPILNSPTSAILRPLGLGDSHTAAQVRVWALTFWVGCSLVFTLGVALVAIVQTTRPNRQNREDETPLIDATAFN